MGENLQPVMCSKASNHNLTLKYAFFWDGKTISSCCFHLSCLLKTEVWSMLFAMGNNHISLIPWCWFKSYLTGSPSHYCFSSYIWFFCFQPVFNIWCSGAALAPYMLNCCRVLCCIFLHSCCALPEIAALQWWAKWPRMRFWINKQTEIL